MGVEKYKRRRKKQVSGSTVNREVARLKRMFNLAVQWDLTAKSPLEGVTFFKEPKRSFRWWTTEEIQKFIGACDDRMKAIALVGLNTGLRISELLNLNWACVDFDNNYLTIEEAKGGECWQVLLKALVTLW